MASFAEGGGGTRVVRAGPCTRAPEGGHLGALAPHDPDVLARVRDKLVLGGGRAGGRTLGTRGISKGGTPGRR